MSVLERYAWVADALRSLPGSGIVYVLTVAETERVTADYFAEEVFSREPEDIRDIHSLRVRCQVADLHVLDHATAKRAHGQLLCEMGSATWRRRIVSPIHAPNENQTSQ